MWENVLKGKVPKKLRTEIENKLPQIEIISFQHTKGGHKLLELLNTETNQRGKISVSSSPKSKGKYHLVIQDIKKKFKIGREI